MVDYTMNSCQNCLCQKIWGGLGFVFMEAASFKMFFAIRVLSHCVSFKTIKIAKNDVRSQLLHKPHRAVIKNNAFSLRIGHAEAQQ